jgi:hypothetical protein
MNENDPKLLEGLRGLAADGPREAPAHVEQRLLGELRRRSSARRRNHWIAVGSAAIAAGLAVMLWVRPASRVAEPITAQASVPAVLIPVRQSTLSVPPKSVRVRRVPARAEEVAINFYRLPDADELPPMESATIVRVQLPMSSLRLIGLPVNEDRAAESIQADMLLGQDGLARGVRIVQ